MINNLLRCLLALVFCTINCSNSFAEPDPFGIEINKSSYQEVKEKYLGRDVGINKYSNGKMYDIDCNQIGVEGIKSMRAIFHQNDTILALITTFDKNKYSSLVKSLSQKYKLISKQDAFVGNKSAKFKQDNTIINLEAPHMSFTLNLSYIHNNFEKLYLNTIEREKEQKRKSQTNAL